MLVQGKVEDMYSLLSIYLSGTKGSLVICVCMLIINHDTVWKGDLLELGFEVGYLMFC